MANLAVLILAISFAIVYADDKYTTKFDNVNIDGILENERLMNNYVNCFKGIGTCTPDASEIKRVLPEALQNDCAKCHPHHRENAKKVLAALINEHEKIWEELETLYDPNHEYAEKYRKEYAELKH